MNKEGKMNSWKEWRLSTGVSHRIRLPFTTAVMVFAQKCRLSIADIYENPEKSFIAQSRTAEQYGSDGTRFILLFLTDRGSLGEKLSIPMIAWDLGPPWLSGRLKIRKTCGSWNYPK